MVSIWVCSKTTVCFKTLERKGISVFQERQLCHFSELFWRRTNKCLAIQMRRVKLDDHDINDELLSKVMPSWLISSLITWTLHTVHPETTRKTRCHLECSDGPRWRSQCDLPPEATDANYSLWIPWHLTAFCTFMFQVAQSLLILFTCKLVRVVKWGFHYR